MKRLQFTKKELCTIPNLLTLIRILCIPAVMTLVILGARADAVHFYVYIALGLMAFAAATDVVDGWIARKFNQGSYIGQCVDPIADKVMHVGTIIALSVAGYMHWAFIIVLAFRELMMIVVGSFVVNKINIKANMLGKVASCTISIGVICCFFHNFISGLWGEFGIDWIIVTIGLVLNWAAAVNYAIDTIKQLKADKAKKAAGITDEPSAADAEQEAAATTTDKE